MFRRPSNNPFDLTAQSNQPSSVGDTSQRHSSTASGGSSQDGTSRRRRTATSSVPSSAYIDRNNEGTTAPPGWDETLHEEPYSSTFYSLQEFERNAWHRKQKANDRLARKAREKVEAQAEEQKYDEIYKRLLIRGPSKSQSSAQGDATIWQRLFRSLGILKLGLANAQPEQPFPTDDELISLAKHFYPPRFRTKAQVFDFGDGRAQRFEVEVGEVEDCWRSKPEWSRVRWINVPFGRGVPQSSIEDIFLHDHPVRRPFPNGGEPVWPFLQTESLNFRSLYDFKRRRDVYLLLSGIERLKPALNESSFKFEKKTDETFLEKDMAWRADHISTTLDYWNLVQSDIPFKLSEGGGLSEATTTMYKYCRMGPRNGLQPLLRDEHDDGLGHGHHWDDSDEEDEVEEDEKESAEKKRPSRRGASQQMEQQRPKSRQVLSQHPFFEHSQMIRNDFRFFHGDDYLLTMSSATGVDFLDTEFAHYLRISNGHRLENPDASCIARLFERFSETGCKNWHRKTTEFLTTCIVTEIGTCPNPFNMGNVAPSLGEAYEAVVLDLNRRRFDPWQRKSTVQLVRDMLSCSDELYVLVAVYKRRARLFEGLLEDCQNMEAEDLNHGKSPDNSHEESAIERVKSALRLSKDECSCFERLLHDIKESLNALFQLRSIEQDELAKLADKQNQAVLLFTGVTIVFLPLSFFTSYFGMNLEDITDKEKSQSYFWKVCGTIALVLVVFVILFAYRHRLSWKRRSNFNRSKRIEGEWRRRERQRYYV